MPVGRGVKALLTGTVAIALAAACTTSGETSKADPTPTVSATPTAAEPATISVAVYGPESMLRAYDRLAKAFTDERPEVTVEVNRRRDVEEVISAVESADPPDVFLLDHDHLARLVENQRIQPVDRLLEARQVNFGDGYQRAGLTAFAANAALQCMPHDVSPAVVYYNKDLVNLRRLGGPGQEPPNPLDGWTWEQFATGARQASRGAADGLYVEPSLQSIAPFVWSAGGTIVDDDGNPTTLTLSDGDSRQALEQLLALVRDPKVTPTPGELNRSDAISRFSEGRLGMILGTRALTPQLREAEGLRFDVMPLPTLGRLRTVADVDGYCVSAETEHLEAAADFVAFAVGREGATITTRPGYIVPSNLEVANSPVFGQTSREPESSFLFNEGVRRAQTMPYSAHWPQLSEAAQAPLRRMFYAPVIDLAVTLEQIDEMSRRVLPQPKE